MCPLPRDIDDERHIKKRRNDRAERKNFAHDSQTSVENSFKDPENPFAGPKNETGKGVERHRNVDVDCDGRGAQD